jgi:hypothetical protein
MATLLRFPEPSAAQHAIELMLRRIKLEYLEAPDLSLTAWQASHLLGLEADVCNGLLSMLVASGFLHRGTAGQFCRVPMH